MDQLHGAHDNGRPANAPAQTRNIAEHRAAQINDVKYIPDPIGKPALEAPFAER